MRMLQSGCTRWIREPSVALMMPPPIKTTSMGSVLTRQSYGEQRSGPVAPTRVCLDIKTPAQRGGIEGHVSAPKTGF
jgi:hypothetical protein